MIKYISLPDGSDWFILPLQNEELDDVWGEKIQGTNVAVGLQSFDIDDDQSSLWCIFEGSTAPIEGWAGAYATVKMFTTSEDFSTSAIAKINQYRK